MGHTGHMRQSSDKIFHFGQFRLDARRNRLYLNNVPVPLRRKTFEILLILVESAGQLVEKDQILSQVWPDQIIEESNLSQHVYKLRKSLGDTPKNQEYILTVPGKGYVFIQNVRVTIDQGGRGPETVEELEDLPEDGDSLTEDGLPEDGRPESFLPEGGQPEGGQPEGGQDDAGEAADGAPADLRALPKPGPNQPWWRSPRAIALVVTGLIFFGGLAVLSLRMCQSCQGFRRWWGADAPPVDKFPQIRPFVTLPGEESFPAFSPDGRFIAFSSEGASTDNQDIYVKSLDQDALWQVTSHPGRDTHVTWSPDGSKLAFLRNNGEFTRQSKLMIVGVQGGAEEELGEVWGGLAWSRDGRYLFVSDYEGLGTATGLYRISIDGQERRNLTTPEINHFDTNPRLAPDGRRLAFVRWRNNINADIFLLDLESGRLRQLTSDQKKVTDLQWSAKGDEIYFISNRKENNRLWRIRIEGGELSFLAAVPVGLERIAISPDEQILAITQAVADTVIDIFPATLGASGGRRPLCTINSSRGDDTPRFSPDGTRIVFVSTRSGWEELWIAGADCADPTQLTHFNQLGVGSPRWSPDGERIVFDRNHNGNTDIFTIKVNGTDLRQVTTDPAIDNMPSWSPDGQWIYFGSYKSSISHIYRVPASGGETTQITLTRGREPIAARDGRMLYYTSGDRLWRKDLQTGQEAVIPELAETPIGRYWDLVDSTLVYITQATGERPIINTLELGSRRPGRLFELPGSLARWVPGVVLAPSSRLISVAYVAYRYGDISLIRDWK